MPTTLPNKGDLVSFEWLQTKQASLAGMQVKMVADHVSVRGHVAHVRGDHPDTPSRVGVWLRADETLEASHEFDRVQCPKCGREEIGPIDLAHLSKGR